MILTTVDVGTVVERSLAALCDVGSIPAQKQNCMVYRGLITNFGVSLTLFTPNNFDISCMGKWVPRLDARGAYPIFQIKFDSK